MPMLMLMLMLIAYRICMGSRVFSTEASRPLPQSTHAIRPSKESPCRSHMKFGPRGSSSWVIILIIHGRNK